MAKANTESIEALQEQVRELERERELLNAIANFAPSLICLVDAEGRIPPTATNRAFERVLGYEAGETGGVLFWERYVPPAEAAEVQRQIEDAIATGAVGERDGRWVTSTGETVDVAWSCTPLPMIASGPLWLISATDITERKRHEEAVRDSRSRIVAAADDARRRLERNLHDGAQQRLIALLLALRLGRRTVGDDPGLASLFDDAITQLSEALAELRELARGIHPAALTEQGLDAALRAVADRATLPVTLDVTATRYHANVEATAYYVVSEALANVAKYANARSATVRVQPEDGRLVIVVADDGVGDADPTRGTGLRGLADRVAALDGTFGVDSPAGSGTTLRAEIPLD